MKNASSAAIDQLNQVRVSLSMGTLFREAVDEKYNSMKFWIGTQTIFDKRKFDEGWVDSGEVIKLSDALDLLCSSKP